MGFINYGVSCVEYPVILFYLLCEIKILHYADKENTQ